MIPHKTYRICLPAILFLISSCSYFSNNNIEGTWFYTYNNGAVAGSFSLTPASFISLMPDKSFTLDFGKFSFGKWIQNNDTLVLLAADTTYYLLAGKTSNTDLQISTQPGAGYDFEKQPYSFSDGDIQPYSLQNNRWRIRAKSKETQKQIALRLANHCRFWKQYFTWGLNNKIETLDVRSTPTPIKIYGNGFAVKNFADLPAEWKDAFYDDDDCKQANEILETVFKTNDIAWAHTDNKYKMFIGAFEQLEQILSNYQHKN